MRSKYPCSCCYLPWIWYRNAKNVKVIFTDTILDTWRPKIAQWRQKWIGIKIVTIFACVYQVKKKHWAGIFCKFWKLLFTDRQMNGQMDGHTLECLSGFTTLSVHDVYTYVVSPSGLSGLLFRLCSRLLNIWVSPFNKVVIFVSCQDLCG